MHKLNLIALCSLIVLLMACSKDKALVALPDGSITFDQPAGNDVKQMDLSITEDKTIVFEIKAALAGSPATGNHNITFAVDSTKIAEYRAKYGAATLLPATAYLFYKPTVTLPAGASTSEAAQLNLAQQTNLIEYTTYVLPIVIRSVDGNIEGPATNRVIYYVFKTGKPSKINKNGWKILGFSSVFNAFAATNVIDANATSTYWASNITAQMPQWVSINFDREIKFTAVSYNLASLLVYPSQGGYPTSIQIETSMDGTNWVSRGIFAGNAVIDSQNKTIIRQTLDLGGLITARYLRFTSLAAVKYANTYDAIFISDISLLP